MSAPAQIAGADLCRSQGNYFKYGRETLKQAAAAYPIEQVLKELPCEYEVFHIAKKDFDHGGTRQFGAEHSDADVMVFMTQDAVPADEFLVEKLVESLLLKEDQCLRGYSRMQWKWQTLKKVQ